MQPGTHISVLLREACDALLPERGGTLVDGTFGRGGHSRELLRRMPADARLIAVDRDAAAAAEAARIDDPRFTFVAAHFGELARVLAERNIAAVDGILLDIGVSSPQLDDAARGFSFMRDGPLDMRMDQGSGPTAADWIATASVDELAGVIRDYGEERFAQRIAAAIAAARERQPVERTLQLAQIVEKAVPARWSGQHPATKTFQAIRIHVNRELEELRMALTAVPGLLAPGGRLAVITFHSLEDRIVKLWMREQAGRTPEDPRLRHLPAAQTKPATMKLVGRDIAPTEEEVAANPRARSARLRVAEKLGGLAGAVA
ncbi:16S rRNA (cytosine(1402)-N(4))-methyltransferase RsmH [Casimicrobium huifangae]|jgi:16S rRNA (cytosine1402-N4)-methyltransferase|uniref:16S rRNA (cytosine(1402)-N(4))-methyltransferase RsmH n=1 Tax=Casimicrobium huifangae TaxID=2591109 RepID=UPI00378387E0